MGQTIESERKSLIHTIRSGQTPAEASQKVSRCSSWGHKWWRRYCKNGWAGLLASWRRFHEAVYSTLLFLLGLVCAVTNLYHSWQSFSSTLGLMGNHQKIIA